jgi:hypothetical protein
MSRVGSRRVGTNADDEIIGLKVCDSEEMLEGVAIRKGKLKNICADLIAGDPNEEARA